jgi:hypothetical protein
MEILQEPESNYHKGYIKLFRSIEDHWLTCNPHYYLAFTKMLIRVNHSGNTFLLEGEIIECKRGQAVFSLDSWSDIFNKKLSKKYWTIQKVRTFFDLLSKDFMIIKEGLRKTTRVTVCNYDSYQNSQHRDNTEITDRQQTDNNEITDRQQQLKNYKELKNEKNENTYNQFIQIFNSITNKNFRGCKKSKEHFNQRIKDKYTLLEFEIAIKNASKDSFIVEGGHLTPEYITRPNILDKWINFKPTKTNNKPLSIFA